jgi:hypothetical protein
MKNRIVRGSKTTRLQALSYDQTAITTLGCLRAGLFSLLVALTILFIWFIPAHAALFRASKMSVSVQPEYDDPRVLVINQADLEASVQLPVDVTFNIPKGADIGMACEVDLNEGHACKPFQVVDKGDYQSLTINVTKEHKVFLEYYYDAFPAGTFQRSFDFIFRPGFPVKLLSMEVQQPLRSSGFTLTPALPRAYTSEGFSYHTQDHTNVSVSKPFSVKISYSKTDNSPSVKPKPKSPDDAPTADVQSGGNSKLVLLVVVSVLGSSALLFGGFKIFRPKTVASDAAGRVGPNQVAGPGGAKKLKTGGGDVQFCTSCGEKLLRGDRFCSQCGHRQI